MPWECRVVNNDTWSDGFALRGVIERIKVFQIRIMLMAYVVLGLAAAPRLLAQQIVSPNGLTSVEGNANSGFPFNLDAFGLPSQRYQEVFAASEFGTLGAPEKITQIAFRPDANFGSAFSSVLPDIQIDLSTTSKSPGSLSATFADNVGADDTVVFAGGPLALSGAFAGPPGGPMNFDTVINLTTPFLYNPAAGNLLLDVRNYGGGATTQFNSDDTPGDPISSVYTFTGDVNSAAADQMDAGGLIVQFTFGVNSVPEPSALTILIAAASGLCILRRMQRGSRVTARQDYE